VQLDRVLLGRGEGLSRVREYLRPLDVVDCLEPPTVVEGNIGRRWHSINGSGSC
jgi:hypothetical protein